jgi:hypothetical protein
MASQIGAPLPSLAEFMKTYSSIPNDFIDDMFTFYNEDTSQLDFAIDLDKVVKWLDVDRDHLRETLKSTYKLGVDYTESPLPKNAPKRWGGHMKKLTMLTPDCFKRLCMLSRGPRSHQVRSYFVEVEVLMMRYRAQLLAGIRADVVRLERNMAGKEARMHSLRSISASSARAGYVYVMRASYLKARLLKIGRTNNLERRKREHSTAQADDIELLFALRTDHAEAVEGCAKAMLKRVRYRADREIYVADLDSVKALITKCDGISRMVDLFDAKRLPGKDDGEVYMVAVVKDKK